MHDLGAGVEPASVDVLMPVRAPAPWLAEALRSLAVQTLDSWRLVIVVHGGDPSILELVGELVPTAKVVTAPAEFGLVEVLNLGLAECTAPFVARLDADDVAEPQRLERECVWLREHPQSVLVSSPIALIDEQGVVTHPKVGPIDASSVIRGLRWKNVIAHPSVMFRRDAVLEAGGYDSKIPHAEDFDLWLRLALLGSLDAIDEPLTRYRIHGAQVTRTKVSPPSARRLIGDRRIALARSRGESVLAARFRQWVWAARQGMRELGSRTH